MDPLAYLRSLEVLGIKFGLDNIRAITAGLGRPQDACPSIIVAGTNGKGSVSAMVAAALRAAGHRVGCYTSPHLVRVEERFAIDGTPVAPAEFGAAVDEVRATVERLVADGTLRARPTYFEVTTAVAFELFRRHRVDIAVLEVGLGGRFDATNIAAPRVGAITSIDLDHEGLLGRSIAEIAFEKAGVIKHGMTVVSGERKPEAAEVIAAACRERGARLVPAWEGVRLESGFREGRAELALETPVRPYPPITLALRGRHQVENALTAVRVLEAADEAGLAVGGEAIVEGLQATRWPGRLELVALRGGRHVLIDAAHNPAGARALAAYLREVHPAGVPLVFGVMRDKDRRGMLDALLPAATRVIITRAPTPRSADPADVIADVRSGRPELPAEIEPDPERALARALEQGPLVCLAGSIYLIGALLPGIRALADHGPARG